MNNHYITIADDILGEFMLAKANVLNAAVLNFCSITSQITTSQSSQLHKFTLYSFDIVQQFENAIDKIAEDNRLNSVGLNVIKMFSPGETMHSYLLAYFLDPNESHGQKNLFLSVFLEKIGIEQKNDRKDKWLVTAERGRIDILLKRNYPHSVVIIENKSNFAIDQQNQLYRYWYQEIYKPIKDRTTDNSCLDTPSSEYFQLIYLAPETWKVPTENSLTRPDGWDEHLPLKVPMKPIHIQFRQFIVEWLTECLIKLPPNNYRILEFTKQYIEFWN